MIIKINQKLFDETGHHFGKPQVTLRDVTVSALLAPTREDEDRQKDAKYRLFLKILPLVKEDGEVDLEAEEIALIKLAAKAHPQLIRGQINDMVEGKFDPAPYAAIAAYNDSLPKEEVIINAAAVAELKTKVEQLYRFLFGEAK